MGTPTTSNPGTLTYIHSDHLGSVSATSNGTTGALVAAQTFDPWGAVRSGGVSSVTYRPILHKNREQYCPTIGGNGAQIG